MIRQPDGLRDVEGEWQTQKEESGEEGEGVAEEDHLGAGDGGGGWRGKQEEGDVVEEDGAEEGFRS